MAVALLGSSKPRRRTRREALSCTECARRKLKCSKTVPCTACKDRGNADSCRRRTTTTSLRTTSPSQLPQDEQDDDGDEFEVRSPPQSSHLGSRSSRDGPRHVEVHDSSTQPSTSVISGRANQSIDAIAADAPVTLEFLALSRGRMLQRGGALQHSPVLTSTSAQCSIDAILTVEQSRLLMKHHQDNLTWIHNVVHLPTFALQCDNFLGSGTMPDTCWLGLYYAMLSVTFYHISPERLETVGSFDADDVATLMYQMSLEALEQADFTANHQVSAIQAVCLLIYVGHNAGQSDRMCILLASAIRIAQCLGLHRLGRDSPHRFRGLDHNNRVQAVVDREVQKRIWWFLIRQDWLQIPFVNTYTVHPSQFNTPMPANCFEQPEEMVADGEVRAQPKDVYTHGSYTGVLNKVAVLIWKTQDRMCRVGHPHETREGLIELYEVVLRADRELKDLVRDMPSFFHDGDVSTIVPSHVRQQTKVLWLALAHKFYSIHRHFQVLSFRDQWFSYTRISCVSISLRSLRGMFALPNEEHTYVARNMWTVNTQIVTAAIWITFELLFAEEGKDRTNADSELESIVQLSLDFLNPSQARSRIAQNGVQLLRMLLRAGGQNGCCHRKAAFDIEEIIASIRRGTAESGVTEGDDLVNFASTRVEDWIPAGIEGSNFEDLAGGSGVFDAPTDDLS